MKESFGENINVESLEGEEQNCSTQLVILGAGRPHSGEQPSALVQGALNKTLLQWQMEMSQLQSSDVVYVGGYRVEEVKSLFPELEVIDNLEWSTTGSAGSLLKATFRTVDNLLVCYGDVLVRPEVYSELMNCEEDVVIAFDSVGALGEQRSGQGISERVIVDGSHVVRLGTDIPDSWVNGQFIGLVHLKKKVLKKLNELQLEGFDSIAHLTLVELIELLRVNGFSVRGVDSSGKWAELVNGFEIANFVLGTKAETLSRLRGMIKFAEIQDQFSFTVAGWQSDKQSILSSIKSKFGLTKLIVRSSAVSEDTFETTNAGGYDSVLNVDPESGLCDAIEQVIGSYHTAASAMDQVLVQPMLQDVVMSGVAFTRVLETSAPWYVLNFAENDDTASITSGLSSDHRTLYVRRDLLSFEKLGSPFQQIIEAIREIEKLLGFDALDIEFAVDSNLIVHILQVRPIVSAKKDIKPFSQKVFDETICGIRRHIERHLVPAPQIPGLAKPLYGNMPDWNPAEIIGTSPSLLASSLYRYLIMDDIWAQQRAEYGYRDVRPSPLLFDFGGKPYVDVRASFSSFIPRSLSDALAGRLLEFYLDWLSSNPELHDKVEFSVLPTCYTPNMKSWQERLTMHGGFTEEEVSELFEGLHQITEASFSRVQLDLDAVKELDQRFKILQSNSEISLNLRIKILLDDCRRFGTLPFAHLARSGFVAMTLLKDSVSAGIISDAALEDFLASINTVGNDFNIAAQKVAKGRMKWEDFVSAFGHLRPGTYDINSDRYDSDPEFFLRPVVSLQASRDETKPSIPEVWEAEKSEFFRALENINLPSDPVYVEKFLRQAIEGREYAKFIFSRNLSEALECIAILGESYDLARDEVAELEVGHLLALQHTSHDVLNIHSAFKECIDKQKERRELGKRLQLPPLIKGIDDLDFFILGADRPNFVGTGSVTCRCAVIASDKNFNMDVTGKIVMIPAADPGYDWLFGKGIAGLITMYGGANSHMAIRCAEFGIPAAIGVGEKQYLDIVNAYSIELSPAQSTIKVLQ